MDYIPLIVIALWAAGMIIPRAWRGVRSIVDQWLDGVGWQ